MKAIAVLTGTDRVSLVERAEPLVQAADEIKVRILRVGICGTDREEATGGRALSPQGAGAASGGKIGSSAGGELVIGHEMLGQVVEAGPGVTRVKPGDLAVFTVRRGCGKCLPCQMNRSDMCLTGMYLERGIWGLDGYQTEMVVDHEQYVVHVPSTLEAVGVLAEPLSVAEKAIDEGVRIQAARRPDAPVSPYWLYGKRCLVAGLGPIGLLGALALRLRGAEVYGLDIVDENSPRPQWLEGIGGKYVDGRQVPADRVDETLGEMEMILEASGVAALEFNLIDALAPAGVYVLTGIPGGSRPVQIPADELMRQFVLGNGAMVGSVNAAQGHFQMAVDDLSAATLRWGEHVAALITHRHPYTDFEVALHQHPAEEIKTVLEWGAPQKG